MHAVHAVHTRYTRGTHAVHTPTWRSRWTAGDRPSSGTTRPSPGDTRVHDAAAAPPVQQCSRQRWRHVGHTPLQRYTFVAMSRCFASPDSTHRLSAVDITHRRHPRPLRPLGLCAIAYALCAHVSTKSSRCIPAHSGASAAHRQCISSCVRRAARTCVSLTIRKWPRARSTEVEANSPDCGMYLRRPQRAVLVVHKTTRVAHARTRPQCTQARTRTRPRLVCLEPAGPVRPKSGLWLFAPSRYSRVEPSRQLRSAAAASAWTSRSLMTAWPMYDGWTSS